jgi:ABC-2 type transport system ATP-binding protein
MIVTTQYVNEAESCDMVALIANGRLLALATPDDLRRQAVGGDVVVVETAAFFDGEQLTGLPSVRHVRQDGSRQLTVVVDDAGTALPDVVEAVKSRGGEVVSAREERPSFDDVFAALVQRDEQARATAEGQGAAERAEPGEEPPNAPPAAPEPQPTDPPVADAGEAEWRPSDEALATHLEPDAAPDADREATR